VSSSNLVLAITGASGAIYGVRLLETWLRAGRRVHLTLSPAAVEVLDEELDRKVRLDRFHPRDLLGDLPDLDFLASPDRLLYHHHRDFRAGIASGSFLTAGMAICPCSMGTVAAIAHGTSQNLVHRAADVHLKERRRLVLVPRETPLHLIHLRNLTACVEAGATVLPAMPAFYTRPISVTDLVNFVVGRICDQFGIEHQLLTRWGDDRPNDDAPAHQPFGSRSDSIAQE
jgi:4-hydroxy-3-polyprenylbenzoate decarboxylase